MAGNSRIGEASFLEARGVYEARIQTAGYKGVCYIGPNDERRGDRSPDWLIREPKKGDGLPVDMGKGWNEVGKKTGLEYISLTFDGPQFERALSNVSIFKRDKPGPDGGEMFDLVWSRPDPSKGQGAGAAPGGGGSTGSDDEIPF